MDLATLGAYCGSGAEALHAALGSPAGLPGLLFALGLTGSVGHCAPMCGPFVLAQVTDRLAAVPAARLCEATRLRSALLWPYHLGRLTTYAALGAVGGTIGSLFGFMPWFAQLSGILLLGAALLCLVQAAKRTLPGLGFHAPWVGPLARLAGLIDRRRWWGGLQLGLLLGFLPCGLVYAALAAASAGGRPGMGALAMLGFGLGTVPSLVVIGIASHLTNLRWRTIMARVNPFVMLTNGIVLAGLGWARLVM